MLNKKNEAEMWKQAQAMAEKYKDQMDKLPKIENYSTHGYDRPCPNCGHCPTCGRGGWGRPWYPYTPYWCGDSPTYTSTSTPTIKTGYMMEIKDGPNGW